MTETSSANDLPSSVGRYQITGALGFGAMGAVYKAFDPLIKRTLAIKTIRLDIPRQSPQYASFIERFYREARISGTLSHPNIVTLFDIGEEGGLPFLAMEFVDGATIASALETGTRFKPEKVIGLVSQVAAALDYAHSRGVVHRDIKPSNLIVYEEDKVKVTDFGIAKLADADITHAGVLLGTPSYMSPEQAMGEKLDGRSDIFSLGVCAFEMLSGLQPFPGANVTAILYKLVHVDPIEPPDLELNGLVPQKWHDVFHKVLAKKPEDRYPTASAFVQDLEYCLGAWFTGLGEETVSIPGAPTAEDATVRIATGPAAEAEAATVVLRQSTAGAGSAPPAGPAVAADDSATVVLQAGPSREASAPPGFEGDAATIVLGPASDGLTVGVAASPAETTLDQISLATVVAPPPHETGAAQRRTGLRWVVTGAGLVFLAAASVLGWLNWGRADAPRPAVTLPAETLAPAPPPSTLPPVPATGSLHLESSPAGAQVLVNGERRGTTPIDLGGLPLGSYQVRVERSGYEPQTREVVLSAEQPDRRASVQLVRSAPVAASAEILSEPAGALITIDGRPGGRTPSHATALTPGAHRLELALEGYRRWSGNLDVVAGQTGRVRVRLERVPAAPPTPEPIDLARVYRSDEVDSPPRKVSGTSPAYPSDRGAPRLKSGEKVSVMVQFVVTETGEIRDLKVVESGGPLLDEVVVAAVRSWKFTPATKRGTRVKAQTVFKQTFLGG